MASQKWLFVCPRNERFNIRKPINVIHYISKKINEYNMTISFFDKKKNQNPFMLNSQQARNRMELQLIQKKPIVNTLTGERLNTFPPKSETRILGAPAWH